MLQPLSPQEENPVGPVPILRTLGHCGQSLYEPAYIRGSDRLFIDKDDARMGEARFRPGFEQRGDGAAVISDKGELKGDCSSQASFVVLAKEAAVLPLHEGVNRDSRGGATKTASDPRGDVLVEQELEHFSASRL